MFKSNKLMLILIILAVVSICPRVNSWNDASRMATIQSLVEKHSFIIDESVFVNTGDKVFVNGHFYSDKLAVASVLGAIVYLPLYHLGIKLDYGWNLAYYLITLLTVKIFWILGLMAFYCALGLSDINDRHRLWLTIALSIASLYFTWSATFNNHLIAASCLIIGFYFLLKAKQSNFIRRYLFYAGSFLSLAGSVDVPTAVFYVGFSFYISTIPSLRREILFYFLPILFTACFVIFINYYISGSVIPVNLNKSYFEYQGSPWIESEFPLAGTTINKGWFLLYYSFNALLGTRGFLLYNPILFIALPFLVREIKYKRAFMREALVVGIGSLIITLYYFLFSQNYGGWSYSFRWFVPMLPLLFFFMYSFFGFLNFKLRKVFIVLFCISMIISGIGLINPWSKQSISKIPIIANVKQLVIFLTRLSSSH